MRLPAGSAAWVAIRGRAPALAAALRAGTRLKAQCTTHLLQAPGRRGGAPPVARARGAHGPAAGRRLHAAGGGAASRLGRGADGRPLWAGPAEGRPGGRAADGPLLRCVRSGGCCGCFWRPACGWRAPGPKLTRTRLASPTTPLPPARPTCLPHLHLHTQLWWIPWSQTPGSGASWTSSASSSAA